MAQYAAAVDQGTTGTRFMVFSHEGRVVCSDYQEHEQIYPRPGWVEHNAMEVWEKTQAVTTGAMQKAGIVNVADVDWAVLQSDGSIAIIPASGARNTTTDAESGSEGGPLHGAHRRT